jgi:hypothetical protein
VLVRTSRPQGATAPAPCLRRRRSRSDPAGAVARRRGVGRISCPDRLRSSTFFCPTRATSQGISSSVFASIIDIRWLPTTGRLAVPASRRAGPNGLSHFLESASTFDGHARLPGFVRAASGAAPESHFLPERRLKPQSLECFAYRTNRRQWARVLAVSAQSRSGARRRSALSVRIPVPVEAGPGPFAGFR